MRAEEKNMVERIMDTETMGYAYEYPYGGGARNELSRTFYQKNKQQYYLLHYACCVCHLAV